MARFTIELDDEAVDLILKFNVFRREEWPDETVEETVADLVLEGLESIDFKALGIEPDT